MDGPLLSLYTGVPDFSAGFAYQPFSVPQMPGNTKQHARSSKRVHAMHPFLPGAELTPCAGIDPSITCAYTATNYTDTCAPGYKNLNTGTRKCIGTFNCPHAVVLVATV